MAEYLFGREREAMSRISKFKTGAATALLLVVTGCGSSTSVSGHVNFEGKSVGNGAITFLPADGRGPVAGGPIADGQYQIATLAPGKKIVQIIGVKKINFALSNAEMERQAKENSKRGDTTGIVERADEIPADAEGNNRQIDLPAGKQTLDFDLKARKK
jgi:hypothetical protein